MSQNLINEQARATAGFDFEKQQDKRNIWHKGKHKYGIKENFRIFYIKEKKEMQREEEIEMKEKNPGNSDKATNAHERKELRKQKLKENENK